MLLLILFYFSHAIVAHPAIENRIEQVTNLIEHSPNNGNLFIKRGDLYKEHSQFDLALSDYNLALINGVSTTVYNYHFALLQLAQNHIKHAKVLLTKVINDKSELTALAHLQLAEISQKQQHWLTSAQQFEKVIKLNHNIDSSIYYAAALNYKKAGINYFDKALSILNLALKQYNGVISLYQLAITIEKQRHNKFQVIQWQKRLMTKYPKLKLVSNNEN